MYEGGGGGGLAVARPAEGIDMETRYTLGIELSQNGVGDTMYGSFFLFFMHSFFCLSLCPSCNIIDFSPIFGPHELHIMFARKI